MRLTRLIPIVLVAATATAPALAAELMPPDRPIEEVVDHYVDAGLVAAGAKAAPEADDATIVRRLTLDLLGRIPTASRGPRPTSTRPTPTSGPGWSTA